MNDLEADDVNMVQELGNLTPAQLLDKIRKLQNLAYQLGLEEGKWSNYIVIIWIASYVSGSNQYKVSIMWKCYERTTSKLK